MKQIIAPEIPADISETL